MMSAIVIVLAYTVAMTRSDHYVSVTVVGCITLRFIVTWELTFLTWQRRGSAYFPLTMVSARRTQGFVSHGPSHLTGGRESSNSRMANLGM